MAAGADYFTAVINNGTDYYESVFNPMVYDLPGSGLGAPGTRVVDDVSNGSPYETVDIVPGTNYFDLQWGEAFSSISGGLGAIYSIGVAVYEDDGGTLNYAFSIDIASLGGDPPSTIPRHRRSRRSSPSTSARAACRSPTRPRPRCSR